MPLHLEGLTLDAVYEHFIRQIAGNNLSAGENTTLKERIEQREQREKQLAVLEARIRKEKQPKKKFELARELKKIQESLTI